MKRNLKSLKDSMLEYAVLNADFLFPRIRLSRVWKKGDESDEIPQFPSGLFDEIIHKSRSMGWTISYEQLLSCMVNRDKVQWEDFTNFTSSFSPSNRQFDFISRIGPSPKRLCLQYDLDYINNLKIFRSMERMSHTLEHLKMDISNGRVSQKNERRDPLLPSTLRLRTLSFHGRFTRFLLKIDPLTLKLLELDKSVLTRDCLTGRIQSFKNLELLSLHMATLTNATMVELVESLCSLTSLKFLNIALIKTFSQERFDTKMLARMVNHMKRLETLAVSSLDLTPSEDDEVPERKLKLLIRTDDKDSNSESTSVRWADAVAHLDSPSGLNAVSMVAWNPMLTRSCHLAFSRLFETGNAPDAETLEAFERICAVDENALCVCSLCRVGLGSFSPDLVLKVACMMCSRDVRYYQVCPTLVNYMWTFAQDNKGTYLAEKFLDYVSEYY